MRPVTTGSLPRRSPVRFQSSDQLPPGLPLLGQRGRLQPRSDERGHGRTPTGRGEGATEQIGCERLRLNAGAGGRSSELGLDFGW